MLRDVELRTTNTLYSMGIQSFEETVVSETFYVNSNYQKTRKNGNSMSSTVSDIGEFTVKFFLKDFCSLESRENQYLFISNHNFINRYFITSTGYYILNVIVLFS